MEFYKTLGAVRRGNKAFCGGEFLPWYTSDNVISYIRNRDNSKILIAVNKGCDTAEIYLPDDEKGELVFGEAVLGEKLKLPPYSFAIIKI